MKKLSFILALFAGLTLQAQEKKFEDLFIPARESCWEKEQRLPAVISHNTREQNNVSLDSLITYWENDCESSEALIRTRLLHELSKGENLDSTISLAAFYSTYISNLRDYRHNDSHRAYLEYTSRWAEELLESNDNWGPREKLCLNLISRSSYQSALNQEYRPSTYKLLEGRETSKALAQDFTNSSMVNITAGYMNTAFTDALAENFGQAHGFLLTLGVTNHRHDFGIDFGISGLERSDSLRIDLEGKIQKSKINSMLYIGLYYSYEFLKGPRTSLAFRSSLGYNLLTTDLDTYDPETDLETRFNLESLNLGVGLEWKVRIYGTRQIGLRAGYNYCNFSRNNELRSNLNGNMINSSLFFRF